MKKRFTDCDKWDKEWFHEMPLKFKMAWVFICDNCDETGVWQINLKLLKFHMGEEFSLRELSNSFGSKAQLLSERKLLIRKFTTFQYGEELKPGNPMHRKIFSLMEKHGLKRTGRHLEPSEAFELPPPTGSHGQHPRGHMVADTCPPRGPMPAASRHPRGPQEEEKEQVKEFCSSPKIEVLSEYLDSAKDTPSTPPVSTHVPKGPPDLVELWNSNCGELPKIKELTKDRKNAWSKLYSNRRDPEYWRGIVKILAAADFTTGGNERGWSASVDFFLKTDTHVKASEGLYDSRSGSKTHTGWKRA